jgi:hypothetical protein
MNISGTFGGGFDEERARSFYFPDTALRSPLNYDKVTAEVLKAEVNEEFTSLRYGISEAAIFEDFHAIIGRLFLRLWKQRTNGSAPWSVDGQIVADMQLKVLGEYLSQPLVKRNITEFESVGITYSYQKYANLFSTFVLQIAGDIANDRSEHRVLNDQLIRVHMWGGVGLIEYETSWCYLDYESLLMLKDLIAQRSISLLLTDLNEFLDKRDQTLPSSSFLMQVYGWGDHILTKPDPYDSIKQFESICVASVLVHKIDTDLGDPSQAVNDAKLASSNMVLRQLTPVDLFSLLRQATIGQRYQTFGLFRHWGHPYVRVVDSIEKNRRIAMPEKIISEIDKKMIERATKRLLLPLYKKHRDYPGGSNSYALSDNEIDNLSFRDLIHWKGQLSILSIFSDKACGLPRSKLKMVFKLKKKGNWQDRRTLVHLIHDQETDLEKMLDEFDKQGIEDEDLTIGVTPKERELKTLPRLFSLLSMKLKYYFGLSEMLLGKFVLPNIPEITMTDSLNSLYGKQLAVTEGMSGIKPKMTVVMNIDFEKWNLNMRGCQTEPCFKILDDVFGFDQIFTMTHKLFKRCLFYCFDGFNYATVKGATIIEDGKTAWSGQEGGCEGLRQKGWTILTVAIIKMVASKHPGSFQLLGQGDNEVPTMTYALSNVGADGEPTSEQQRKIMSAFRSFKEEVFSTFARLQLPIKWEETWTSSKVFMYGKAPTYEGCMIPVTLKKLARCLPFANEDHPNIFTSVSSICASALGAGIAGNDAVLPMICGLCVSASTIHLISKYHPLFDQPCEFRMVSKHRKFIARFFATPQNVSPSEFCQRLLLGHICVGGLPAVTPLQYLHRGFPDPLTEYLTWVKMCCNSSAPSGKQKGWLLNYARPIFAENCELISLVTSPAGINIVGAGVKEAFIKSAVLEVFRNGDELRNREIKSVFQYLFANERKLNGVLEGMTTICPALLEKILSCSAYSAAAEISNKITSTKTIRLLLKSKVKLYDRIARIEADSISAMILQSSSGNTSLSSKDFLEGDVADWASMLRNKSWGLQVRGVTYAHPFDYFRRRGEHAEDPGTSGVQIMGHVHSRLKEGVWSRGPYLPMTGKRYSVSVPQLHDHTEERRDTVAQKVNFLLLVGGAFSAYDDSVAMFARAALGSISSIDDTVISHTHGIQDLVNIETNLSECGIPNILPTPLTNLSSQMVNIGEGLPKRKKRVALQTMTALFAVVELQLGLSTRSLNSRFWELTRKFTEEPESIVQSTKVNLQNIDQAFPPATNSKLLWYGNLSYDVAGVMLKPATVVGLDRKLSLLAARLAYVAIRGEQSPFADYIVTMSKRMYRLLLGLVVWYLSALGSENKKRTTEGVFKQSVAHTVSKLSDENCTEAMECLLLLSEKDKVIKQLLAEQGYGLSDLSNKAAQFRLLLSAYSAIKPPFAFSPNGRYTWSGAVTTYQPIINIDSLKLTEYVDSEEPGSYSMVPDGSLFKSLLSRKKYSMYNWQDEEKLRLEWMPMLFDYELLSGLLDVGQNQIMIYGTQVTTLIDAIPKLRFLAKRITVEDTGLGEEGGVSQVLDNTPCSTCIVLNPLKLKPILSQIFSSTISQLFLIIRKEDVSAALLNWLGSMFTYISRSRVFVDYQHQSVVVKCSTRLPVDGRITSELVVTSREVELNFNSILKKESLSLDWRQLLLENQIRSAINGVTMHNFLKNVVYWVSLREIQGTIAWETHLAVIATLNIISNRRDTKWTANKGKILFCAMPESRLYTADYVQLEYNIGLYLALFATGDVGDLRVLCRSLLD